MVQTIRYERMSKYILLLSRCCCSNVFCFLYSNDFTSALTSEMHGFVINYVCRIAGARKSDEYRVFCQIKLMVKNAVVGCARVTRRTKTSRWRQISAITLMTPATVEDSCCCWRNNAGYCDSRLARGCAVRPCPPTATPMLSLLPRIDRAFVMSCCKLSAKVKAV